MRLKPITDILRAFWRRAPQPFTTHEAVVDNTYQRAGKSIEPVDFKDVMSGAGVLEAALAMTDELPHTATVNLIFTRRELSAFVCYMRQLDSAYRDQGEFIARHIKLMESPGEFKGVEEAAQVSPERYAQLTGRSPR